MIFFCMGYFNSEKMHARPNAEIEALMDECQQQRNKVKFITNRKEIHFLSRS